MSEVITKCACGQLPALEPVQRGCEACDAEPGEECRPDCIGQAAHLDELGIDVTESHEYSAEPDATYPHLVRAHCSCGWAECGYVKPWLAERWHAEHVSAAPQ